MNRWILATTVLCVAATAASCASTDGAYPSKNLDLIVTFAPGGPSDRVARALAPCLSDELDTQVPVQNLAGGGGVEGISRMLENDADGYTAAVLPNSVALHPLVVDDLPYDMDDVLPLRVVQQFPSVLVGKKDEGPSGAEVFTGADGEVTIGTPGATTVWHYATLQMAGEAESELRAVPFEGTAETVRGVLGGHIDLAFAALSPDIMTQVDDGDLELVAVAADERLEAAPDVPTLQEVGFGDLVSTDVFGFFAVEAGTDPDVIEILEEALDSCATDDDLVESVGEGVVPTTPVRTDEIRNLMATLHDDVATIED